MIIVFSLLAGVIVWQRHIIYQIYIANQVNTVGWAVNGGIALLFICGLVELIKRFFEYRNQEQAIHRFKDNVKNNEPPLRGIRQEYMVSERFLALESLNRRRANINQNALAATLIAAESSRNSFLKFVHNVLILTGVFGTIISLSISLLGASDILQSGGQAGSLLGGRAAAQASGLSTMIYGMSTALSTTMTAIIAYLFFGYFYIKLTDTQTFLISKIEEVTAATLMPHLQLNQAPVVRDYSDKGVSPDLDERASENQALMALIREIAERQQQAANQNSESMKEVVTILQRGFRLRSDDE
ncbi:hypothetical protein [Candidatus Spongiihabitans sp.]|uniref:hypothetical protein n=1 Tax=Candidatus Spongiihabitans sp. TaxID=3101308 RepID=UPI003C7C8009